MSVAPVDRNCRHGGPEPESLPISHIMLLEKCSDRDAVEVIQCLPDCDFGPLAAVFKCMTVDAIGKGDTHMIQALWFRHLLFKAATEKGRTGLADVSAQLLGRNQSFVASVNSIAREVAQTLPCQCLKAQSANEVCPLAAMVMQFLESKHVGKSDDQVEQLGMEVSQAMEQAELADLPRCLKEAELLLHNEKTLKQILAAVQQCVVYSKTAQARAYTTVPTPTCNCREAWLVPDVVILDSNWMSCSRCGSSCQIRPSRQSQLAFLNACVALKLLKALGRSEAFSQFLALHIDVFASAIGCATLPLQLRSVVAAVATLAVPKLTSCSSLLDSVGDMLRMVIEEELELQAPFVMNPLELATFVVQRHSSAATHVMSKGEPLQRRAPRTNEPAPAIPASVCVLLFQHLHQIMETGLGTPQSPELQEQVNDFRDKFGFDMRPMIVFLALDFLVALQVAGVDVAIAVKSPWLNDDGVHVWTPFGTAVEEYLETLEMMAVVLRVRYLREQVQILRGLAEPRPIFTAVDFKLYAQTGVPLTVSTCSFCQKQGDEGKLLTCGRCKIAKYCGKECQKQDWPSHKQRCQKRSRESENLGKRCCRKGLMRCHRKRESIGRVWILRGLRCGDMLSCCFKGTCGPGSWQSSVPRLL